MYTIIIAINPTCIKSNRFYDCYLFIMMNIGSIDIIIGHDHILIIMTITLVIIVIMCLLYVLFEKRVCYYCYDNYYDFHTLSLLL